MRTPSKLQSFDNHQRKDESNALTPDSTWKSLYRIGGVAALTAGIIFRRNLGAEISLITRYTPPNTAIDWFTLLQNNRLLGLSYLNIFDIVDYALVDLMFLALYVALRRANESYMTIATVLGFVGIAVYFASNTSLSMLSLSNQYAAATTDAQRSMLLAAGQAVLAMGEGTGIYTSFLLLATAGMIISAVMLRSNLFGRVTAYVGILASAFDLAYIVGLAFVPASDVYLLSVSFLSAAGLLLLIWHLLIGLKLYQLGRTRTKEVSIYE